MFARGGDVRWPHVHGHPFHVRPFLERVLSPKGVQALFLPIVDHVQYTWFIQSVHHCDVLVSPSNRRLVHSHTCRQRRSSSTLETPGHCSRADRRHLIPAQSHPFGDGGNVLGCLQPVDHQRLEQRRK